MSREKGVVRAGLLGPYGSRNLGDTAIQMTVIKNLRARWPMIEIVGICPDPEDTACSLGIAAFPLDGHGPAAFPSHPHQEVPTGGKGGEGWPAFLRISAFVRSLDLLVVSGGGQLDDFWGGAWAHPFAMFTWAALARLWGVRVAFVGVGMDRLSNPLSRFFTLSALRLAHYRSFRDTGTLAALRALGLRAPSRVCPDLAFGLEPDNTAEGPISASEPFVAINPISVNTWAHGGDHRHEAYMRHLAAACSWVLKQGLRLRIVCSQDSMDRPTAVRLAGLIQPGFADRIELRDAMRVPDFLEQVRGARVVVASRLHGAILSLVTGAPVVAVSPLRKLTQLMSDIGLARYSVELQDFSAGDLVERIRAALDNGSDLRRDIKQRTQAYCAVLSQTYDDVLALV